MKEVEKLLAQWRELPAKRKTDLLQNVCGDIFLCVQRVCAGWCDEYCSENASELATYLIYALAGAFRAQVESLKELNGEHYPGAVEIYEAFRDHYGKELSKFVDAVQEETGFPERKNP